MKRYVIVSTEKRCFKGIKYAYLVSLPTTTIIILNLHDLGRPSIKSSNRSSHTLLGIGKGYNNPTKESDEIFYL